MSEHKDESRDDVRLQFLLGISLHVTHACPDQPSSPTQARQQEQTSSASEPFSEEQKEKKEYRGVRDEDV